MDTEWATRAEVEPDEGGEAVVASTVFDRRMNLDMVEGDLELLGEV